MQNEIHILNGDALKEQLNNLQESHMIILREAFIEGPLAEKNFFENRAQYIKEKFNATLEEYKTKVEQELSKIKNLTSDKEIVLWFEYDLFCQCNFWYACHEILKIKGSPIVSWVHPNHEDWSGFGKMGHEKLKQIYQERQLISRKDLETFATLWRDYRNADNQRMKETAQPLYASFPKLQATIQAHINRTDPSFLLDISKKYLQEVPEQDFRSFFKKFNSEQGIYGFGDLHVKEYYNQIRDQ